MKRLVALASAILLLASVSTASVNAGGKDASYIKFWEFAQYNSITGELIGLGGDHWVNWKVDYGSIPNLNNIDFNLWLGCDGLQADWNNCISGFTYDLKSGTCVRFFDATNYSDGLFTEKGPKSGSYFLYNHENKITSIRWGDWKYDPVGENYRCYQGAYD